MSLCQRGGSSKMQAKLKKFTTVENSMFNVISDRTKDIKEPMLQQNALNPKEEISKMC